MKDFETYIRPDGTEITINTMPANLEYAKKAGWVLKIDAGKTFQVKRETKDIDE